MNMNKKIFLVDDDGLFLKNLEIDFREQGTFVVETYPTGELCLEHLSARPDLIVLDYHLNGVNPAAMNGMATLDKIKVFDAAIPVIILSSQDHLEVAIDCMSHGAADYLVKSDVIFVRLQRIILTHLSLLRFS